MRLEDLVSELQVLDVPDALELSIYEANIDKVIADVDRTVLDHPRVTELLGGDSTTIAVANHRNHAGFMAEIFRSGTLEDLPLTAVWAYRAYTSQGVHPDYWKVHLPAWEASFIAHGLSDDIPRITAVYAWFTARHNDMLALAQEPAPAPTFDSEVSAAFGERLQALDLGGCIAIIDQVIDDGTPFTTVLSDLIDPALQLVGAAWEDGVITVAHEHRATAIAQRLIGGLLARMDIEAADGGTVLVTSAESEFHDLGALMLAIYFEAAGWHTTFLGANVPNEDVASMAAEIDADIVAVSVTIPGNLPSVRELVSSVRANSKARVLVGGGLFIRIPTLAGTLDADLVTYDPVEAIQWANQA